MLWKIFFLMHYTKDRKAGMILIFYRIYVTIFTKPIISINIFIKRIISRNIFISATFNKQIVWGQAEFTEGRSLFFLSTKSMVVFGLDFVFNSRVLFTIYWHYLWLDTTIGIMNCYLCFIRLSGGISDSVCSNYTYERPRFSFILKCPLRTTYKKYCCLHRFYHLICFTWEWIFFCLQ